MRASYRVILNEGCDDLIHVDHPVPGSTYMTCCGFVDCDYEESNGPVTCQACIETIEAFKSIRLPAEYPTEESTPLEGESK